MRVVFYISEHGLGHAARQIELARTLVARRPEARITIRTAAARWLFDLTSPPALDIQPCAVDTGVVQIDSLRLDEEATARTAAAFYGSFTRRVDEEARILKSLAANAVIGDIPPLAFAAADRADIPSFAVANFTWDWIFGIYPAFDRGAPNVIPTIREAYAKASLALRLPLHGGFETIRAICDIPFIARSSTRDPADTRRVLRVDPQRPLVLASFGAFGLDLPLDRLRQSDHFTLIAPAREPPPGLRYEDLVAASDVVVSKPGYGIVSECIANDTALLYTSRGRFAEYDVFVSEMPRLLRCRHIAQEDLIAGHWTDAILALLAQPRPPDRARVDGAEAAVSRVLETLQS